MSLLLKSSLSGILPVCHSRKACFFSGPDIVDLVNLEVAMATLIAPRLQFFQLCCFMFVPGLIEATARKRIDLAMQSKVANVRLDQHGGEMLR